MTRRPGPLERYLARRLATVMDMPTEMASEFAVVGRGRAERRAFIVEAASFAFATSRLGRRAVPERLRARAVGAFLDRLLREPGDVLMYLGVTATRETSPCAGLLPS